MPHHSPPDFGIGLRAAPPLQRRLFSSGKRTIHRKNTPKCLYSLRIIDSYKARADYQVVIQNQ